MLPFLKPRKLGTVMMAKAHSDGDVESLGEEGEMHPGLVSAMDDFLSAHSQKDSTAMAKAMHSFHSICSSTPDEGDGSED